MRVAIDLFITYRGERMTEKDSRFLHSCLNEMEQFVNVLDKVGN